MQHGKIFYGSFYLLIKPGPMLIKLDIAENFCGALVIVPEARGKGKLFFLAYFVLSVIDVKETSSGQQRGPS
jgi:hypothetical protein